MKPHSTFQPKCIAEQDKPAFRVWEQLCLSSLAICSFLLRFPTEGIVSGQQRGPPPPSPAPLSSSARWAAAAAGPSQRELVAAESSPPTLHPAASWEFAQLGAELAAALLLLILQPPSLPTQLFLTQIRVSSHFTLWPPASASRNRL